MAPEQFDEDVKKRLEATYSTVRELHKNRAAVQDKITKKWGYVDRTGKLVIDCKYDEVGDFQ